MSVNHDICLVTFLMIITSKCQVSRKSVLIPHFLFRQHEIVKSFITTKESSHRFENGVVLNNSM